MSIRRSLSQRGALEEATQTRSSGGDIVDTWTAKVQQVPMLLRFAKSVSDVPPGVSSVITHVIYLEPYLPLRIGKWRMLFQGLPYLIVSAIDQGGQNKLWKLLVRREA